MTIFITKSGNVFWMRTNKLLAPVVNIEEGIIDKIKYEGWGKIKSKFAM
ncbi:MAG: hypothetical protein MUP85_08650 [Candidatus Lokiarchaeota archaeon]|nr:hypothetical protein [Candidatus Lokiarchaeota archaeon]